MIGRAEARVRALRGVYRAAVRPALFRVGHGDAERAHGAVVHLLGRMPSPLLAPVEALLGEPRSPIEVAGIRFPGRVGFGAGLDKDGDAADQWRRLGFGFIELGTVTALPQPGNPAPRLFRLIADEAIVNRMGFNNRGAKALATRLRALGVRRGNQALGVPVGVSIGKSKITPLAAATADYLTSLEALAGLPDYFAVNVSSPNTPGLRQLQGADELSALLPEVVAGADGTPVFVKFTADLDADQVAAAIRVCEDAGVAGFIATNTTLSRAGLRHPGQAPEGGLSGAPLTRRALDFVTRLRSLTPLPIIGVGGIMTPADAQRMFDAGAELVEVFTGFIYHGPALVAGINELTTPHGTRRDQGEHHDLPR